jgi:CDGSH-type Zn-finger protein
VHDAKGRAVEVRRVGVLGMHGTKSGNKPFWDGSHLTWDFDGTQVN